MITTFPDLLTFAFFAPTLLRLAAGGVFLYMTWLVYKHRRSAAHAHLPIVGVQPWTVPFTLVAYAAIGVMLVAGYYTQVAAMLGAIAAWKEWYWGPKMQALFPLSRSTALLLMVICLSLMLTGAGALAFDLRL